MYQCPEDTSEPRRQEVQDTQRPPRGAVQDPLGPQLITLSIIVTSYKRSD